MRDEVRFRELSEAGFEVLSVWDHEVWSDPETVRERIHAFSRGVLDPELFISARKRGEALAIWRGDMDSGASISAPE
jgi:G:T-mismatch repair DNA endonuclease (very short patch repair protein)